MTEVKHDITQFEKIRERRLNDSKFYNPLYNKIILVFTVYETRNKIHCKQLYPNHARIQNNKKVTYIFELFMDVFKMSAIMSNFFSTFIALKSNPTRTMHMRCTCKFLNYLWTYQQCPSWNF